MSNMESKLILPEDLLEIRCQIDKCPFGMPSNARCCFGEVAKEDIEKPIKAYHHCKKSKMLVIVVVPAA